MLESIYELPLSRTNVPAHIIDIVYGCIPRSFTDEPKDDAANANDRIQASPSKRARTASSSTLGLDGDDPFDMPKPFLPPPMSTYPPSSTRTRSFTSRTRSHTSVFSTRSRASGSTAFSLPDPPKPAHPGISVCPSPAHLHRMGKPVYVRHAVERFTWEDEIAGVNMGRDCVPVLWRGCGPACLDFLDQKEEVEDKEEGVVKEVGQSSTLTAGSDQDEEHVVEFQPADLSGGFADAFFEEDG
ncbi:hypothetical protein EUX98_g7101 [Antrodiella citrinella]|uniref:Uncharacterized protein n=1 Tax=Antrodiella citrinella TaxID=2447956 RepID=A0A4S4MPD3_9APHY|nr:hypothetical protein EUX98_g7101 [Antrodiella citrinella]